MQYMIIERDIIDLFGTPFLDSMQERLDQLRSKGIVKYRVKTIKSGPQLEAEIIPIYADPPRHRSARKKETRREQKNLNNKNAIKHLIRLINTNFTENDIWATNTYDDKHLPANAEAAQAEMQKYIRRLRRVAEKMKFPPLKYVYVTEYNDDMKKKVRAHHHLVTNFPDRDLAENLWHCGGRKHTRRLQPDEYGLEGLTRYITKDPAGTKRYVTSRNLKKPIIYRADSKFTRAKVNKLVYGEIDAKTAFEKMYKGYRFTDMQIYTSDIVAGAYVYVRMRRRE